MALSRFLRRWCIPILGVIALCFGLVVFLTQSTLTASWTVYDLAAGTALAPGAPTLRIGQDGGGLSHQVRQLSLSGQISIAVGIALLSGWVGFALGRRRVAPHHVEMLPFTEAMRAE
ncbi:hypothetical protein GCM10027052_12180 [Parafrigoribacterium mesophilum]|uniref:hypothetical protein n=1 Tax=Parafrigoribacterium mesophilum TaxID=433646 RepID=UPI0031FC324E